MLAKNSVRLAGAGSGGHDAVLVVAELGQDELEVVVGLVLVDLGEQLGLGAARAGSVAFRCCDGDVLEVHFAARRPPGR